MNMAFEKVNSNCAEKGRLRKTYERARDAVKIGWNKFALGVAGITLLSFMTFGCSPAEETIYKDDNQKQDSGGDTKTQDMQQKADVTSPETHTKDNPMPTDVSYQDSEVQYVDVLPEATIDIVTDLFPEAGVDASSEVSDVVPDLAADSVSETAIDISDVQQEIIEPPSPLFSYTFTSLIGDYLDRTLEDRGTQPSEYPTGTGDLSDTVNPFTDGNNGFLIGAPNTTALYGISGTEFKPLATVDVVDTFQALEYKEMQNIWLSGNVYYSQAQDDMLAEFGTVAYTIKFDGPGSKNFGIPICGKSLSGTDYTVCDDYYKTEGHKINITIFGNTWTILHLNAPATEVSTETRLVNGGSLELGKELTADILNLNETLTVGEYMLKLENVLFFDGKLKAQIGIYDKDGGVPMPNNTVLLSAGNTLGVMVNGYEFTIHCWETVNGGTENTTWADLSIFSETMKLNDGMSNKGTDYFAVLGWKNRGASETDKQPDHLRTIILHATDVAKVSSSYSNALKNGDYVWFSDVIKTPWKLTFEGIDLNPEDYDTLQFLVIGEPLTIKNINGDKNAICTLNAPVISITSQVPTAFFFGSEDSIAKEMLVAQNGLVEDPKCPMVNPTLFMKSSTTQMEDKYFALEFSMEPVEETGASPAYTIVNDGNGMGEINITYLINSNVGDMKFYVAENAMTNLYWSAWDKLEFSFDGLNGTFSFAGEGNGLNYEPTSYHAGDFKSVYTNGTKELGFVAERGSIYQSASPYEVVFKTAKKLGKAKFTLATTEEQ